MARSAKAKTNSTANLCFESRGRGIWLAADKLRCRIDAAEHKHTVRGPIFLEDISDSFEIPMASTV